jgi:pimeloyl-ACP methyl ester carboxylesterase
MESDLSTLEHQILFRPPQLSAQRLSRAAAQIGAEEVRLDAEDGVRLYGWRLRAGGWRAVLGFGGNATSVGADLSIYRRLLDAGFDLLQVNYRGYPGSEGSPSEEGLRRDARAAWNALTAEIPPEHVTIYGKSLGGAVAVGLAAEVQPRALVLCCTFESAVRLGAEALPWLPVRELMRNRFDSAALAPRVRCPVLILHGTADRTVPPAHAADLARHFPQPPQVLMIRGAGHREMLLDQPDAWARFLRLAG